jgi:hypothetical protein
MLCYLGLLPELLEPPLLGEEFLGDELNDGLE